MDLETMKREVAAEIKQLNRVYLALGGLTKPRVAGLAGVRRKKRTMSKEGRDKIAAAQRARWAKQKKAA